MFREIMRKAREGRRLGPEEGLLLLEQAQLPELGVLAAAARWRRHPAPDVTLVVDTNINYTNVCTTGCSFCAFHRVPGHGEAYARSVDEILEQIARAAAAGVTRVLLQGGINPDIPADYYFRVVREARERFPGVEPHFFSPPELDHLAALSGLGIEGVLARLWEAGQRTIPGGGAEMLVEGVRRRISPRKISAARWLEIMAAAHKIGFHTTATMMYGHVEQPRDVITHLDALRGLQDQTGGFLALAAWSFKGESTPLGRQVPPRANPNLSLRLTALARIYLDNFPHIQAPWFGEGMETGQLALHFGADDFGGTLLDESVLGEAGYINRASRAQLERLINLAGFRPVERDTLFRPIVNNHAQRGNH